MKAENLIAAMATHPNACWKTTAPHSAYTVFVGRIGFASIPILGCEIAHRQRDNLVAVVRQIVLSTAHKNGLPINPSVVAITPTIQWQRCRILRDDNPDSDSYGKRKKMHCARYSFEIIDPQTFSRAMSIPSYRTFLTAE